MKKFVILHIFLIKLILINIFSINNSFETIKELENNQDLSLPLSQSSSLSNQLNDISSDFENNLPPSILKHLIKQRENNTNDKQKDSEINNLRTVPKELFVPLFERFPKNIQESILATHNDANLSWNEKNKKIKDIIETIPDEIREEIDSEFDFPPFPPAGYEQVLPVEIYKNLLTIHQNYLINAENKSKLIDEVLKSLPIDILKRLPLPPGFEKLPKEFFEKAQSIFIDKNINYEEKTTKILRFVKSLSEKNRALIRPKFHSSIEVLPQKKKNEIENIYLNENLNNKQKYKAFWRLVDNLPLDQRKAIYIGLGRPFTASLVKLLKEKK